jgi:enamine deaminase RidA (YjgF/YER057c/UK114 family)
VTGGPEQRLTDLGLSLPEVAAPIASYVPALRDGDCVWTSGQLPTVDGKLIATGKVGGQVSVEDATKCAQLCGLNALAAVKSVIGDLVNVTGVIKAVVFVASEPGFTSQSAVANGLSDLLGTVFGEHGRHARSAVGVSVLPMDAPVEAEIVFRVI